MCWSLFSIQIHSVQCVSCISNCMETWSHYIVIENFSLEEKYKKIIICVWNNIRVSNMGENIFGCFFFCFFLKYIWQWKSNFKPTVHMAFFMVHFMTDFFPNIMAYPSLYGSSIGASRPLIHCKWCNHRRRSRWYVIYPHLRCVASQKSPDKHLCLPALNE